MTVLSSTTTQPPGERSRTSAGWSTSFWLWAAVAVACCCLPLFVGLGARDLANDEAIYSFSVDVMVESGDWLVPKATPREDIAFLEKPPLKCWIVALPIWLGLLPHDEFGLRFWDALFGAVAFLYVFAIGRRLAGPLCGLAALFVLFAHSPLLFEHGLRENNMEAALLLSYCAAMYHFLAWRHGPDASRGRLHLAAIGLCFALGFMTKFVAALFLPLVLGLAAAACREDRQRALRDWRALAAVALLVLALCAPWFVYAYWRFGANLWKIMFGVHVFTRFTSYVDPAHLHPWSYYLSSLADALRASGILWFALAASAFLLGRTIVRRWADGWLLLLWFAVPFALISTGSSKLYHYAYPFLPPVALAVGYLGARIASWGKRAADRWADGLDAAIDALSRRLARPGFLSGLAIAVAIAALALAVAVFVLGPVRFAIGNIVLFRASSPIRSILVAVAASAFSGRARRLAGVGVIPVAVFLLVVPLDGYRHNLAQLTVEHHPLRSLAACMRPVAARQAVAGTKGPGTYVESDNFLHPLCYYLRSIGPWHQFPERSDPRVFEALYLKQQPVLLSDRRFDGFKRAMQAEGDRIAAEAARAWGTSLDGARAAQASADYRVLALDEDELLLPGAYGACAVQDGRGRN